MKLYSGVIATVLACGSLAPIAALASGEAIAELETNNTLRIEAPNTGAPGVFGIVKEFAASNSAVTYRVANGGDPGRIQFNISDRVGDTLDNPLFCFDYAPEGVEAQLRLDVNSMGGKAALQGLGIDTVIQYAVGDSMIVVTPPASSQCFYRGVGESGQFGLFGRAPEPRQNGSLDNDNGRLFSDSFEAEMRLEVSFQNLDSSIPNGSRTYGLEIRNAGQADLSQVSFKEVYPTALDLYPVAMSGTWDCGGSLFGDETVRVEKVAIPAGEAISCSITRIVSGSGTLRLHAAAVAGPGPNALFDVAEVEVEVTGD